MPLIWLCVCVLALTVCARGHGCARAQLAKMVHDASDGEQVSLKKFGMLLMAGQAGQLLQK